jgi:Flp pilus assembly protein CpaB
MNSFIQEAMMVLENIKTLAQDQQHDVASAELAALAGTFVLEAQKQRDKHEKLQAYLSL